MSPGGPVGAGPDATAALLEWVGWLGQACFFGRFFVQWAVSERARRSLTPAVFWRLSLAGTVLSGLYAWLGRHDIVFAASYACNVVTYGRNARLAARPGAGLPATAVAATAVAVLVAAVAGLLHDPKVVDMMRSRPDAWMVVGVAGSALWTSRFFVQWIAAERTGRADLTRAFFATSLVAWALLFPYAVHEGGLPFIVGLLPVPFINVRNLVLMRREAAASVTSNPAP